MSSETSTKEGELKSLEYSNVVMDYVRTVGMHIISSKSVDVTQFSLADAATGYHIKIKD